MRNILSILLILLSTVAHSQAYPCPSNTSYPITLTFDDGPSLKNTPKILNILKKYNIKATFFVSARKLYKNKRYYKLLDRILSEGHTIGSHSYYHDDHTKMPLDLIRFNVGQSKSLLDGYMSPIIRLPYGKRNWLTNRVIGDFKLRHVGWNIDPQDWNPVRHQVLDTWLMVGICENKGGIIILHDIQKNTANNLDRYIRLIKEAGHRFVDLKYFVKF